MTQQTTAPIIESPRLPVVIHLEAPGSASPTGLHNRIASQMHRRGWMTAGENQAWHLSRAGATVVHVDARAHLDDDPVTVELVQAKEDGPYAPWKRLAGGEHARVRQFDAGAVNNAGRPGAFVTDVERIVQTVADLLADNAH